MTQEDEDDVVLPEEGFEGDDMMDLDEEDLDSADDEIDWDSEEFDTTPPGVKVDDEDE